MGRMMVSVIATMVLLGGCLGSSREAAPPSQSATPIDEVFTPPSPETIPGDQRGEQIRLGYEIVVRTQEYAKPYIGNALNCTNCHLDTGLDPNAASFVGLSRLYPEYRARMACVVSLADRINECVERSLNGTALPPDSSKLHAVVAYIEWLSRDVPPGSRIPWRGVQQIQPSRQPDPDNGKKVFTARCVFCHGADGQGGMFAPPLWGPSPIPSPQRWRATAWQPPSSKPTCLVPEAGRSPTMRRTTWLPISRASPGRISPVKRMIGRKAGSPPTRRTETDVREP